MSAAGSSSPVLTTRGAMPALAMPECRSGYATILPRDYYTSAEIFEIELERVFAQQWILLGHIAQVPHIGDYFVQQFARESILIVRESNDKINGFYNVCRHRGHRLCASAHGHARRFVCPYHHWSYGTDGSLKTVPGCSDGEHLDYTDWGLKPVRLEVFHGFIFGWLSAGDAPSLALKFATAAAEFEKMELERLKEVHRETYEINANWKTLLENYLECYHCRGSHPELCVSMDLAAMYAGTDSWQDPYFVGATPLKQSMKTASLDGMLVSRPLGAYAALSEVPSGVGVGIGVVPTLSRVIVHVDHCVSHALRPIDVGRVGWETRWYVSEDAQEGRDYNLARLIAVWDATNKEDIALCEGAYQGVLSRSFTPGPLDPKRESAITVALRTYLAMMKSA